MASYYRKQLEEYLSTLDIKADTVLDVGGSANPVKTRVKSWHVKEYKILDNLAEEKATKADYVFDLNGDLIKLHPEWAEHYDVVFCLEVFEYVFDPVVALYNLRELLKKGGELYITFPFVYPIHNPVDIDYLRYTPKGAQKLLDYVGFEVKEVHYRRHKSDMLEMAYIADGMRRAKEWPDGHDITGMIIKAQAI